MPWLTLQSWASYSSTPWKCASECELFFWRNRHSRTTIGIVIVTNALLDIPSIASYVPQSVMWSFLLIIVFTVARLSHTPLSGEWRRISSFTFGEYCFNEHCNDCVYLWHVYSRVTSNCAGHSKRVATILPFALKALSEWKHWCRHR